MDRVIFVDGRFEDIALLKACFRILFPECEIHTVSREEDLLEEENAVPDAPWPERTYLEN